MVQSRQIDSQKCLGLQRKQTVKRRDAGLGQGEPSDYGAHLTRLMPTHWDIESKDCLSVES